MHIHLSIVLMPAEAVADLMFVYVLLLVYQVAQRSEQCDAEAVLMQAGAANKQKDSWGTLDMPGGFL